MLCLLAGLAALAAPVDTHVHLHPVALDAVMGQDRARPAARVDTSAALLQAADNLVAKLDQRGIGQALVVLVPSKWGTAAEVAERTRAAIAAHPERLKLVAGGETLNPLLQQTEPDAVTAEVAAAFDAAAEAALAGGAVAFGELISYHLCMARGHSFQVAAADHPLFLRLADIAARRSVPIDLHMEAVEHSAPVSPRLAQACTQNPAELAPTVPALERLLAHNREARIVWQHIGWDNTGQLTPALLKRLLAAHPNLFLSLRVADLPAAAKHRRIPNRIVTAQGRIEPEWRALIDAFPDRIVLGSDEFVPPTDEGAKLARSFASTWALLDELPPELADKVGRANAMRVYGLR